MSQQLLREITAEQLRKDIPDVRVGDTVKVAVKIVEGGKERIQSYEGVVIAINNSGISRTMTVRKVFKGVGVERVFPMNSPMLDSVKIMKSAIVRRAKLYYLRGLTEKATRLKERRIVKVK